MHSRQYRDYLFYRVEVGKRETTDPTSVVDAMLAIDMYPADKSKVDNESLAQYNPIPHEPAISKPITA